MTSQDTRVVSPVQVQPGTWSLVAESSTAGFSVRDKLVTTVHGTFPVRSGLVVLAEDGALSHARIELEVAGVATGNVRRDRDLVKRRFLDADDHPVLVVQTGASAPGVSAWVLPATLRARGAEASLTLEATPTAYENDQVRVRVTGRLDRSGLGITAPSFIIGRHIDFEVDALFARA